MPQALYYAPSFAKMENMIMAIAPDLDVILLNEDSSITRQGVHISIDECEPEWFWVHAELMSNKALLEEYFQLIQKSPKASWLHTINTGLDGLSYMSILRQGLTITNNHSQAIAIAEYVLGQVLSQFQQHSLLREQQEQHVWKYTRFREIANTTWLIVGFGHIGKEVARRVKAFGGQVETVRRKDDGEGLADTVYSQGQLYEALPQADVVVLACSSNKLTQNMVDAHFFSAMKKESILVNVARGDLVDEDALKNGLNQGQPGFAILDVLRDEPADPDAWIWDHQKVFLTPHCSNAGSGMRDRSSALFLDNLLRKVADEPLLNEVSEQEVL